MQKNKKSIKPEDLSLYGIPKLPSNSEDISSLVLPGRSLMLEVDLLHDKHKSDRVRAWINWGQHHNCECHKVAALCFFQWTPEGKHKQVPMVDGLPNTNYITLGTLQEMTILKD